MEQMQQVIKETDSCFIHFPVDGLAVCRFNHFQIPGREFVPEQFTSCCPAWVKFAEMYYPEILPNISSAKSPIGMQGPTIKTYFAKKKGIDPTKIVNVALTPCTAKKFEIRREEMSDAADYLQIEGLRDMDAVITTRELAKMAREAGIDFATFWTVKCHLL